MKRVFYDYMSDELKLEQSQQLGIFCLLTVICGVIGWIYEFIFYYFNGGMKEFYMQGGNFLPWINIYAIGAIMIIMLTHKFKKSPLLVFILSFFSTGILEYVSGLLIYVFGNGARYWDYNVEILNFGNIGGFVCLRSVTFFGISALLLMYIILPGCIYLAKKCNTKKFVMFGIILFSIFLFDEFYNLILSRIFHLPSAIEVYKSLGFHYVE